MKASRLLPSDIEKVNELHKKYYKEFNQPDFTEGYLCAFKLTDDNDNLLMAGGIRPLAETILVTDASQNPHLLGRALIQALEISKFTANRYNIDLLCAFVKDESYQKHLIKHGYSVREGVALDMRL